MMRRFLVVPVALLLLAACDSSRGGSDAGAIAPPAPRPVAKQAASTPGQIRLPGGMGLPKLDRVKAAPSWDDRLATMTVAEKSRLESLNARYNGLLVFDSPEEQRKLIQAGVPMPEEWLAAAGMSDAALAELASANSPKGSLFFADRQLDRFLEARQRFAGTSADSDFDRAVINARTQALVYASNALALTRSPFAAYLYGSIWATLTGEEEPMAAGIAVAWALGDERAQDLARAFQERRQWHKAPPLEFGSVAAIESMMWRDVHRYRPL